MDDLTPAFPLNELNQVTGDVCAQHFGMTLRDYFAAKAMEAFIGRLNDEDAHDKLEGYAGFKKISQAAYWAADAMLEARKEQSNES